MTHWIIHVKVPNFMYINCALMKLYHFQKFLSQDSQRNKIKKYSWVLVAHACNPSYLGSRDQEDWGLKPPWANSLQDPILKKLITESARWSGSRWRSWVQTLPLQKTKQNNTHNRQWETWKYLPCGNYFFRIRPFKMQPKEFLCLCVESSCKWNQKWARVGKSN
jgi:hypothetical protein